MNARTVAVRRLLPLFTAFALVLLVQPALAQSDRRDRQDPELVVDSGGRQGTCDQLLFTPDGKHLLAAGDDKVVRVWPCADGKLSDNGQKVLRWSIWREQRGAIYALAVSRDGRRVAVGGLGVRASTVALIDQASGNILGVVTPKGEPGENFYAVMAVAFDSKAERVAYGTADGSVWLWDLRSNRRLGRHAPSAEFNRVRLVHFLDDNQVLSVAEDGSVTRWDLASDSSESLPPVRIENYTVFRATLSPDGRWLAAAFKGPVVAVRSLDGKEQKDIRLEQGEFPRSLAFDPRGRRLAVGVGHVASGFYVESDDRIRICDLAPSPPAVGDGPAHSGKADCLAFHPDGRRLAIAGGDNHEVAQWDLDHLAKPASLMRGAGSGIWEVALSKDGKLLGFRNQRDPAGTDPNRRAKGPWRVFDLPQRTWLEAKEFTPLPYLTEANGWRVVPDDKDPFVWYAVDGDGNRHALPLDRDRDGMPRCWVFLPPRKGQPTRLAVGHYWGLSVYELTAEGATRTRLCAGHQGEVVALGVAAGGEWLVSASNDQTIAAWSLAGQGKPDIGARFAVTGERLVVERVKTGSAAWEAGLVPGDEIDLFAFAAKKVDGGPEAWLERLRHPVPGKEHYFHLTRRNREGKPVELVTTVRQRPLWRFFPTRNDEWVLWMWRNPYYDTSTTGDSYIGWHLNSPDPDLARTPRFYAAEQFRKLLEKQEVLDELLDSRDPEAALRRASDNPVPLRFDQSEPPDAVLEVGAVKPGEDVAATLKATPHGDNPDYQPVRAELWINDFRLALWDKVEGWERQGPSYVKELKIPDNKLRSGRNVVIFQTFNRLGGRSDAPPKVLEIKRPAAQPRLLGLAVGINDYKAAKTGKGGRGILNNLVSAKPDAQSMRDAWVAQPLYNAASIEPLLDAAASRSQLLQALDDVAARAGPDDRFVLFLAGHGVFLSKQGNTFVFCCPHFDPDRPLETGISSQLLQAKLAAIPCRKLVLFDACHSGEVANPARQMTPSGQGPIIVAACDRTQFSWENKALGHGLFTWAVLEALGPRFGTADRNGDGKLDVRELYEYTRSRMPALLRDINLKEYEQVPIIYVPPQADAAAALAARK